MPQQAGFQGRQVQFATTDVPPPPAIYITPDDALEVVLITNTTVGISVVARILQPDGSVSLNQWDISQVPSRTGGGYFRFLAEGFLLSLDAYSFNSPLGRGQCYCVLYLRRQTFTALTRPQGLACGYITAWTPVFWPGGPNESSFAGRGNIRSITGTTPGAGNEIAESVPIGAIWRPISFRFYLSTSATAGNRQPTLTFTDGSNIVALMETPALIPASNGIQFFFGDGVALTAGFNGIFNCPLLRNSYLPAFFQIKTDTFGMQAGDQYSGVQYLVEEWLQS